MSAAIWAAVLVQWHCACLHAGKHHVDNADWTPSAGRGGREGADGHSCLPHSAAQVGPARMLCISGRAWPSTMHDAVRQLAVLRCTAGRRSPEQCYVTQASLGQARLDDDPQLDLAAEQHHHHLNLEPDPLRYISPASPGRYNGLLWMHRTSLGERPGLCHWCMSACTRCSQPCTRHALER